MPKRIFRCTCTMIVSVLIVLTTVTGTYSASFNLKRNVAPKPVYNQLPSLLNTNEIVIKLKEGMGQPEFDGQKFLRNGAEWDILNGIISTPDKSVSLTPSFITEKSKLDDMRAEGMRRTGVQLADLTLYNNLSLNPAMSDSEKLSTIKTLNDLDIVEIAYFPPYPELATMGTKEKNPGLKSAATTPNWEYGQYYLQPAPTGVDAYYAWSYAGGAGDNIKVIDIEGNWIQTHEDLHGGTDNFHIAGAVINDPDWWNHGTAVLGEIAADSNSFGMTGIAHNVSLGTVSIGSMSVASAITTAINNSDTGDVMLIELHAPGPAASGTGQDGYVCMEYWQENFDAILQASSLGRIVVEAAGNGAENFDDPIYGSLFDPTYRYSGAVIVGASYANHTPAGFTNYGQRVDVHAFGTWDVFTFGYGDLFGSSDNNYYTASFSGTSSASPIITGSCAVLEGVMKANHGRVMDQSELHAYLTDFSTPQAPSYKHIGPLPDLQGSVNDIVGIAFIADTTFGETPFNVNFSASSGLSVDTWTWDFGDGDSSFVQSPNHTYTSSGMYTVSVQIDAGGDIRTASKTNYIIAYADTLSADSILTEPGQEVIVTISANTTIPAKEIYIPIEFGSGDLSLTYDSVSTVGCRTDYFETQEFAHYDPFYKRFTYRLISSNLGTSPELAPGDGPLLKIYFKTQGSSVFGQTASILTDGYNSYLPTISSLVGSYVFQNVDGEITVTGCCVGMRGNIDGDANDEINIADIVYLVTYAFAYGPTPPCFEEADVDGSGNLDIGDIVYMVDYSFGTPSGPPPLLCYY